jgi:hypothetical protein
LQDFSAAPHAARNTRRDLHAWSDDMKKLNDAAEALHGYLLREESFDKLQQIRNQLFLMAGVIFAATQAEEQEPLEIQRSRLGQCFESFGLQIDEVLSTSSWMSPRIFQTPQQHRGPNC